MFVIDFSVVLILFYRSSDGKMLIASSTDGYCSIVTFSEGELGNVYEPLTSEEAVKTA